MPNFNIISGRKQLGFFKPFIFIMPEDRRLAAIMFTDIVGYTSIMAKNEDEAFQMLRKNRNIHKPIIKRYRGEWLKEMGDGILASFNSASDAVRCAGDIQEATKREGINVRIGIHEGEVVFEGNDVLGDGVNVASRLEEVANTGCINISEAVYKDIRNKVGIRAEFLEEKTLKNLEEPIKVYQVNLESKKDADTELSPEQEKRASRNKVAHILIGFLTIAIIFLLVWNYFPTRPIYDLKKSIAVLPFRNLTGDAQQEYMSDGLTDEVINHLFKIESFSKVVSLNSVLTYKNTNKRIPEIAKELDVNYILEGTWKKMGDQIKVSAKLIDTKNDINIWGGDYNQPLKEIFSIQADIAIQIAKNLKAYLNEEKTREIRHVPTQNKEAYRLLQQAKPYWYAYPRTEKSYNEALALLNKALELDPDYAEANAWLGFFILQKGGYSGEIDMATAAWEALPHFEKALEKDQNVAMGHTGIALINQSILWNFVKAEEAHLKSLELEPNNVNFINNYLEFLIRMNRLEDAIAIFRQTQEKEVSGPMYYNWAQIMVKTGQYKTVKDKYPLLVDLYGSQTYKWAGIIYLWMKEYELSLSFLDSATYSSDEFMVFNRFQAAYALTNKIADNGDKADQIIENILENSKESNAGSPDYFMGWYYSGSNQPDSAFFWLEEAYKNRSPELSWLKADPVFDNLRNDNRYWDLYKRIGFAAYDEHMARAGE
jgi:TolB-like protein/class 3 adenylate cyclase